MTKEEHKARHVDLHNALDELVADWTARTGSLPSKQSVMKLMQWSRRQTKNPTKDKDGDA